MLSVSLWCSGVNRCWSVSLLLDGGKDRSEIMVWVSFVVLTWGVWIYADLRSVIRPPSRDQWSKNWP